MEGLCLLTSKYTVEINICDKQTVDVNIGKKHCSEALLVGDPGPIFSYYGGTRTSCGPSENLTN